MLGFRLVIFPSGHAPQMAAGDPGAGSGDRVPALLPYVLTPFYSVVDPFSTLMFWRWAKVCAG
jgi:hypothetical protein